MDSVAQPQLPSALGDFRILGVLGRGGSGIVYDATWGPRRVALKVLHSALLGTDKNRALFLTEAQRLQQITHPSVVKVLAVGTLPDGRPYLAMEHLDGETLASVIARGALSLDRALPMFTELCSAVAALHDQGLIHRDLKPENVFVVAQRHAVLLDFGIAKDLAEPASTVTQEGNVRGTPAYMAPERFFGSAAGIATDVYELAVVLYMMLGGRLPWDVIADPEARLSPRPLVELAAVPEALDIEIRRALSTRAQNRPASARALLDAVRSASTAAVEPGAGETARIGSGITELAAPRPPTSSGSVVPRPPPAIVDQPTPLAWAPTLAAQTTQPPIDAKRRWPLAALLVSVAVAGGVVAWWRLRDTPKTDKPAPVAVITPVQPLLADAAVFNDPNDPWGSKPEENKAFALTATERTPEDYRREAMAAARKFPADTRFVIQLQLAELRANSQTRDLLDKSMSQPKVVAMSSLLPACVKGMFRDAEWFLFASPDMQQSDIGTMVVRGRWRRADVVDCIGDATVHHQTKDGTMLYRVGDDGWLDFINDQTAYITQGGKLSGDRVHELVKGMSDSPAAQAMAKLPAARSVALVSDARDNWTALGLPRSTEVTGWLRVERDGLTMDIAMTTSSKPKAVVLLNKIKPEIEGVFGSTDPHAVGRLEVVAEDTTVHIRGTVSGLMLGLVTTAMGM